MASREKLKREDYEELIFDKKKPKKKKSKSKQIIDTHVHLINMIANNRNKKQKEAMIETMNQKQMNGIKRYLKEFLEGRVEIPKNLLKKLAKDKQFIYDLLKDLPLKEKKTLLIQKGGSIQSLAKLGFQASLQ